jgi:hypothetical protein
MVRGSALMLLLSMAGGNLQRRLTEFQAFEAQIRGTVGCVPPTGAGAVGKWPAVATAQSQTEAGYSPIAVAIAGLR